MGTEPDYKRVSLRRRTALEWQTINEILLDAEIGVVTDTSPRKFKIGDGITPWRELPYVDKDLSDRIDTIYLGYGVASPSDEPSEAVKIYNVSEVGTYTNFSGISVIQDDLDSGLVQLRKTGSGWIKVVVPIKLVYPVFYVDDEMNLRSTPFDNTKINFVLNDRGELIGQI